MAEGKVSHADLLRNLKKAGCSYRWSYPVVKLDRAQIRTCCQVAFNEKIDSRQIAERGKDLFLNSEYLLERKMEMLNGVQHSDCGPCWMLEKDHFPSMRAAGENIADFLELREGGVNHATEYDLATLGKLARIAKPKTLELQLDNVCDLACIYCNAGYSTTWEKKLGKKVEKPSADEVEQFQELFWRWYENHFFELEGLCIIGGEPLASPIFFKTLDRICEIHSKNKDRIGHPQFLSITSNLNTRPETFRRFLELVGRLKNHFNLSINASCEAVGERAEFIREGLDWKRFHENALALTGFIRETLNAGHSRRIDFAIHAAQNALSISSLPALVRWAKSLEDASKTAVNLIQNIVSYPPHLSAQAILPTNYARYCDEAIRAISEHQESYLYMEGSRWGDYGNFLERIASGLRGREPDEKALLEFRNWHASLDSRRKQKFAELFPDLLQDLLTTERNTLGKV